MVQNVCTLKITCEKSRAETLPRALTDGHRLLHPRDLHRTVFITGPFELVVGRPAAPCWQWRNTCLRRIPSSVEQAADKTNWEQNSQCLRFDLVARRFGLVCACRLGFAFAAFGLRQELRAGRDRWRGRRVAALIVCQELEPHLARAIHCPCPAVALPEVRVYGRAATARHMNTARWRAALNVVAIHNLVAHEKASGVGGARHHIVTAFRRQVVQEQPRLIGAIADVRVHRFPHRHAVRVTVPE